MTFDFSQINWLAVIVAALVTFFIGGAWYSALFQNVWVTNSRYSEDQIKAMQASRPMPVFMGMMVVAYVVIAIAVALLVNATGVKTVADGLVLGLILWVIAAAVSFTGHISSPKGWGAYYVDVGYQLVYLPLMGVILAAWR
jgi:uncharacterized protein YneF (UPF0154 family)